MTFSLLWAYWNGSAWIPFPAGSLLGFYGTSTYGSKVKINEYNLGQHLRTSLADSTQADTGMVGIGYDTSSTYRKDGGVAITLDASHPATTDCIRIVLSDGATSISTEQTKFWAFNGADTSIAPVDVNTQSGEQGDVAWQATDGAINALYLADQATPAISHYFYLFTSCKPISIGQKTDFAFRFQTDYY